MSERRVRPGEVVLALAVLAFGLLPLVVPLPLPTHPATAVLTTVWAAALIPLARRKPVWAMLATAPLYVTTNFWAVATTTFAVFIAARRITPRRRLWLTVLGTAVAQVAFSVINPTPPATSMAGMVAGAVFGTLFLLVFPALAGMLLGQRKPLIRLLQERNDYLERAQALTASKARTEERSHIAGEMHDMLGHRLSLISIHAGALELATASKAPQVQEQAELLRTTAALAMAELREILGVLRANPEPESLDEHVGTRSDVTQFVASSVEAGLDVRLDWSGDDVADADPRTRRAIHRVVREGLTNVHKHAPDARTRVSVTVLNGRAQVLVVNATSGATAGPGTRRGLVGLEERVGLLGGQFAAGPAVEGGFRVAADVPLHPVLVSDAAAEHVVEAPAPIAAEVLTLPRVMASGCLGALVVVPVFGIMMMLLLLSTFGLTAQLTPEQYASLTVGTEESAITEEFGIGRGDDTCVNYLAADASASEYRLCFTDGKLVSKEEIVG
ncbi:two-component sensor histidine kinase [Lentzea sp. NBRC 105346]|uniref:sensor histidine kinase n=1 Tax=Lentzea sp. NBRC 105346 TaxID=3032205 RepID=UPI0024A4C00B|nr:histidine kinase [Lentzea sp. NBRC 105346]GLZ36055.1 two-component sensor histidine kinase [Lentzea sp. NBRC 105346]